MRMLVHSEKFHSLFPRVSLVIVKSLAYLRRVSVPKIDS